MIEKMQFVSIMGLETDFERVVNTYLTKYEIHLENALTELKNVTDLKPYASTNPYKQVFNRASQLIRLVDCSNETYDESISSDKAIQIINDLNDEFEQLKEDTSELEKERNRLKTSLATIEPFRSLDFDVSQILHFKAVKFRFGRISKEYIEKFDKYIYDTLNTVFYRCHSDDSYVWGVCFVPSADADEIDTIYKSMHFERIYLPDEYEGTAEEAAQKLEAQIIELNAKIAKATNIRMEKIEGRKSQLYSAYKKLSILSHNYDIRKMAALTESHTTYYILCGWMTKEDATKFKQELDNDEDVYCFGEDEHPEIFSKPPTKLRNWKIFKPFELFVRMYGLPAYTEFDPTAFVALTYAFIFGWMFGDVGQGLLLVILGFSLYHFKKMDLGAIIGYAGIFSTFFGFMFGSVFGFEDVIDAVWIHPVSAMSNVPFIGKLNTVFIVAIGFGMGLVLLTMLFNIINNIRNKDTIMTIFDTNGIAGFVFYGSAVLVIGLLMAGKTIPATAILIIMFVIPLILIALKEPIEHKLSKHKEEEAGGIGMTLAQCFFELFEVLLSYFSNTLSFIRIGAFAVSHASMMEVVLMLAGAENGATPNWIVIILGNLFVCGLEGLVVGIQVLRLEYYELFSRFYKGNGREFKPYCSLEAEEK